jgi:hypothetical protein
MADYYCRDDLLRIDDIGGKNVRVILLSLEPASRFWLSLDGDAILFERLLDIPEGSNQRACKPVGETVHLWNARLTGGRPAYVEEIEFIERPQDSETSGYSFYRREAA